MEWIDHTALAMLMVIAIVFEGRVRQALTGRAVEKLSKQNIDKL
jgi:hypothetical protein